MFGILNRCKVTASTIENGFGATLQERFWQVMRKQNLLERLDQRVNDNTGIVCSVAAKWQLIAEQVEKFVVFRDRMITNG